MSHDALQSQENRPPVSETSTHSIFFGDDGLRAGWSLLIFFAILTPLVVAVTLGMKRLAPHHAAPQSTAQSATQAQAAVHRGVVPSSPRQVLIPEALQLFVLLIPTVILSKIERRPIAAYGIGATRGGWRQFAAGTFWGLACLSVLVLLLNQTGRLVFDARLLFGGDVPRYALIWLFGFLLVGVLEEYFVRGYLQFTLARGLGGIYGAMVGSSTPAQRDAVGFWVSAIFFSILFGLGHGSNPGESPIGLLSAGLAGMVFVFSLWRTGSLLWAIGFHTTWDWAQSFLYGVADSGTMVQGHLLATHPVGRPIWSGGTTGPEGSIFIVPVLALVAVVIFLTLPGSRGGKAASGQEVCG